MKAKILLIIFVLLVQYSCKEDETLSSFAENNKKIEDSNENQNIKNESFLEAMYVQAEKDDDLIERKDSAKRVHAIGDDFYKYIDDLKKTMKEQNSMKFVNELFFNNGAITTEGNDFIMNINNYRESMNATIGQSNPRISGMVNNLFDTSIIEDRRGLKTNWLTLNFNDFSPIVSITKLSSMQADIRKVETQYFADLLGVDLHTRTKTTANKIKSETEKQLGDNTIPANVEIKTETPIEPKVEKVAKKEVAKKEVTVKKETVKKETSTKKYHVVKRGETMYRIALKSKISIAKLKKLNRLKGNSISVGQKLRIK